MAATVGSKKVIVTGASGLLGRAIRKVFDSQGWDCVGTGFSRASEGLVKVDLRDQAAVESLLERHCPAVVVHSAAERRPDVVENSPEDAEKLNVAATQYLADVCAKRNIFLLYISTDYVFDGKSAPYKPTDAPNPLNAYGKLKLRGEQAISGYGSSGILRVPVLYGAVERPEESAVTTLLRGVLRHPQPASMCNYQLRYPTHCDDVALVVLQICQHRLDNPSFAGIWHWSDDQCLTKYQMAKHIAEGLSLPYDHLVSVDTPPEGSTPRPYNTRLDCSVLKELGFGKQTDFRSGIKEVLAAFVA